MLSLPHPQGSARRASRAASRTRFTVGGRKSTANKTTAASPLPGWNPGLRAEAPPSDPINIFDTPMRTGTMLPAEGSPTNHIRRVAATRVAA